MEIKRIGAQTGGRTLFFGGLLFGVAGSGILLGLERHLPVDTGYLLMGLFIIIRRNPTSHDFKKLKAFSYGELSCYRVDQGEYRIICAVDEKSKTIKTGHILNRNEDYKELRYIK
jgi:mRNA-degrading endonuclease RelE of RelBE toxin-antitoxin system